MSGKLDRRDEVRFIAYLEANHYIPDNKKAVAVAITEYISIPTGYHVEIKHKQNIMITKRLIRK
ncbi:MAG: hypothetical protein ACLTZM_20740 [Ruminococcus sp.]